MFANGCFWGSEKGIWRFPYGIYSTAVGYCAGFTPNPTYNEACSGMTGHTEGVRVVYDPKEISFADILRWFWEAHDPTSGMGQGNDRGTQYVRCAAIPRTTRGDAAAATRIFCGNGNASAATWIVRGAESRRRRRYRSGFYWFDEDQKRLIEASKTYLRRADIPPTGRRDAAATTWIFRGDGSRGHRGCDVDIPWRRVAATAAATWKFGRDRRTPPGTTRVSSAGRSRRRSRRRRTTSNTAGCGISRSSIGGRAEVSPRTIHVIAAASPRPVAVEYPRDLARPRRYHQQYLAKPGSRPYCSAQPQGVDMAPFEAWCPEDLRETYAPKLPEAFWNAEKPRRGCSVVNSPNEPVVL